MCGAAARLGIRSARVFVCVCVAVPLSPPCGGVCVACVSATVPPPRPEPTSSTLPPNAVRNRRSDTPYPLQYHPFSLLAKLYSIQRSLRTVPFQAYCSWYLPARDLGAWAAAAQPAQGGERAPRAAPARAWAPGPAVVAAALAAAGLYAADRQWAAVVERDGSARLRFVVDLRGGGRCGCRCGWRGPGGGRV